MVKSYDALLVIQQQQQRHEIAVQHVVHVLVAAENYRRDEDADVLRVAAAARAQPEHGRARSAPRARDAHHNINNSQVCVYFRVLQIVLFVF